MSDSSAVGLPRVGVYELIAGLNQEQLPGTLNFLQQLGFSVDAEAILKAEVAARLYGVSARARVLRLRHATEGDGLLRMIVWASNNTPSSKGKALLERLRREGARWATVHTADLLNIENHVCNAERLGEGFVNSGLVRNLEGYDLQSHRPFIERAPFIHEMAVSGPALTLMFFQRHDYDGEMGETSAESHFLCSRLLHFALVTPKGRACDQFYEDAFGYRIAGRVDESEVEANRQLYGVRSERGEKMFVTILEPEDGGQSLVTHLHTIELDVEDLKDDHHLTRPGCVGVTGYTVRVDEEIAQVRERCRAGGATELTELFLNEFAEPSFSMRSPDGYWWNVLEQRRVVAREA